MGPLGGSAGKGKSENGGQSKTTASKLPEATQLQQKMEQSHRLIGTTRCADFSSQRLLEKFTYCK